MDHVTPVKWFELSTELIIEFRNPTQTPAVVICRLSENSAKGDRSLSLFSKDSELDGGAARQSVYAPKNVSIEKVAMLAKQVVWMFSLFWGITNKDTLVGVGPYDKSAGVAWYVRAWQEGRFKAVARQVPTKFERRIELLKLAMTKWGIGNAFVFDPSLLDGDFEELLLRRFAGSDCISKLVQRALVQNVAGAPRNHDRATR